MKPDTYSRVFEVADALLASGVRPTQHNVREQLGKGSASTIHKALSEWWSTVGERLQQGRRYPDLPDSLSEAMISWWQNAVDQSRRQFEGQQDQAARQLKKNRQENAEVIEKAQIQQQETLTRLDQQLERYQQLQQQQHELEADRRTLEQRVLEAETTATELKHELKIQTGVISKLEAENERVRQQLANTDQQQLLQENKNLRALVAQLDSKYNQG
ncbi:MAG: DNA-binding protein [Motiliproteus sp.]